MTVAHSIRLGTRGKPEESRAAILKAAVKEFAREGVAGARTDAIARSARVNKALLYYYFKDKESLYQAVLDDVFSGVRSAIHNALSKDLSPRERLKAYICAHFDYIASHPLYHRLVHAEFLRAGRDPSRLQRVAKQYFRPVFSELVALLQEGERSGDFRGVNPLHFIPSMISVIVFYFTTAPIMRVMTGADPMSPELLAERRQAVIDFISAALFTRNTGERQ
ncbi:MAG TPA: TetR/AcrR family transcriptional regulator [Terriglobales bacterium]|nr:TetR/AcrR family transcriptional regulator [Terriglobales bacterium]